MQRQAGHDFNILGKKNSQEIQKAASRRRTTNWGVYKVWLVLTVCSEDKINISGTVNIMMSMFGTVGYLLLVSFE